MKFLIKLFKNEAVVDKFEEGLNITHLTGAESSFDEKINETSLSAQLEEKIETLETDSVNLHKTQKFCPECGTANDVLNKFCVSCGYNFK